MPLFKVHMDASKTFFVEADTVEQAEEIVDNEDEASEGMTYDYECDGYTVKELREDEADAIRQRRPNRILNRAAPKP